MNSDLIAGPVPSVESSNLSTRLALMGLVALVLLIAHLSFMEQASAETIIDPLTGTKIKYGVTPPRYVYHWTTYRSLLEISLGKTPQDRWDKFKSKGNSSFLQRWPQFKESKQGLLFAWHHPVTGMRGGVFENYGEALVRIEIDPKARVVEVSDETFGYEPTFKNQFDLSAIDIVIRKSLLNEIVILNPNVIKAFTSDSRVLSTDLLRQRRLLDDPKFVYDAQDLHLNPYNADARLLASYAKQTIDRFLTESPTTVPSFFMRDENGRFSGQFWKSDTENEAMVLKWESLNSTRVHQEDLRKRLSVLEEHWTENSYSGKHLLLELKTRMELVDPANQKKMLINELDDLVNRHSFYLERAIKDVARIREEMIQGNFHLSFISILNQDDYNFHSARINFLDGVSQKPEILRWLSLSPIVIRSGNVPIPSSSLSRSQKSCDEMLVRRAKSP